MEFHRFISYFLLSVMLLVQAHAAVPHQHSGASGSCGVVCQAHEEGELDWWEAVVEGVHEMVHRHAESASCESDQDVYRPAGELELEWQQVGRAVGVPFFVAEALVAKVRPRSVEPCWKSDPLEVRSLRGPPSRG